MSEAFPLQENLHRFRFLKPFGICFVLLLLGPLAHGPSKDRSQWIFWNVGQGQWVTWVHGMTCDHFDLGGERSPLRKVIQLCRNKYNRLHISHEDLDHVSFLFSFVATELKVCVSNPPILMRKKVLQKTLSTLARCETQDEVLQVFKGTNPSEKIANEGVRNNASSDASSSDAPGKKGRIQSRAKKKDFDTNASSQVLWADGVLLPGDSPSLQERQWRRAFQRRTEIFLLSHHGSRTANDFETLILLKKLGLKQAVASARFRKYRHPHALVVQRLLQMKIPLLRTEVWGNLHFETFDE